MNALHISSIAQNDTGLERFEDFFEFFSPIKTTAEDQEEDQRLELTPILHMSPTEELCFGRTGHFPGNEATGAEDTNAFAQLCDSFKDLIQNLRVDYETTTKAEISPKRKAVKGFNFRNKKQILPQESDCLTIKSTDCSESSTPINLSPKPISEIQKTEIKSISFVVARKNIEKDVVNSERVTLKGKGFNFRNSTKKVETLLARISTRQVIAFNSQTKEVDDLESEQTEDKRKTKNNEVKMDQSYMINMEESVKSVLDKKNGRGFDFRNCKRVK